MTMMMTSTTTISSSSSSSIHHHFSGRSCTTRSNNELRRSTNITKTNKIRNKIKAAAAEPPVLPYRVGHGFDLHRFASTADIPVINLLLVGLDIPLDRGSLSPTVGDVLCPTEV